MSSVHERISALDDEMDQLHAQIRDLQLEVFDSGLYDDEVLAYLRAAARFAKVSRGNLELAGREIIKSGVK